MNALERQREWDKLYLAICRSPRLYRALRAGAQDGTAHLPERTAEEIDAKERAAIRHAWVLVSAKRQEEGSVTR